MDQSVTVASAGGKCVKHSKKEESGTAWVVLVLKVLENRLFFAVENSNGSEASGSKPGIGLMNVKRRLELLYKDRHELILNREEPIFKAQLNLELDGENPMHDSR